MQIVYLSYTLVLAVFLIITVVTIVTYYRQFQSLLEKEQPENYSTATFIDRVDFFYRNFTDFFNTYPTFWRKLSAFYTPKTIRLFIALSSDTTGKILSKVEAEVDYYMDKVFVPNLLNFFYTHAGEDPVKLNDLRIQVLSEMVLHLDYTPLEEEYYPTLKAVIKEHRTDTIYSVKDIRAFIEKITSVDEKLITLKNQKMLALNNIAFNRTFLRHFPTATTNESLAALDEQ